MHREGDPELRPNELSIMDSPAVRGRERRGWPLPVSLYRLVFAAVVPAVVLASWLGLSVWILTIGSLVILVGQLLSRTDRWRPPGDTWRAGFWPQLEGTTLAASTWPGLRSLPHDSGSFSVVGTGIAFVALLGLALLSSS